MGAAVVDPVAGQIDTVALHRTIAGVPVQLVVPAYAIAPVIRGEPHCGGFCALTLIDPETGLEIGQDVVSREI
jgi:hypothetical protein